jgi:hypothetical protein
MFPTEESVMTHRLTPALAFFAALTALASPSVRAEPPRAEGRIESDEGRVEILGKRYRIGETIELPEGFLRVEEAGPEDGQVGSFSVVAMRVAPRAEAEPAEQLQPRPVQPSSEEREATGDLQRAGPAAARSAECSPQRTAYLAELMRLSGIEISSPAALMEGLGAGEGPDLGFYWFALQTDPFRPLAWSSELRSRAEALTRCVRGG